MPSTHRSSYPALELMLAQVIEPLRARRLIDLSLSAAGLREIPATKQGFIRFVTAFVQRELERVLGDEAELIIESLCSIAERMPDELEEEDSAVHARLQLPPADRLAEEPTRTDERHSRPTPIVPPPGPARLATLPAPPSCTVVLATLDDAVQEHVEGALRDEAHVCSVVDVVSLLDMLTRGDAVDVLVLDLYAPSVRVPTLLTIEEHLPSATEVVVWSPDAVHEHVRECQSRDWLALTGSPDTLVAWIRERRR